MDNFNHSSTNFKRISENRPAKLIEALGITKSYAISKASVQVLSELDIALAREETLAIVGASGIGKSTLLHILGTLDRPDRGALIYDGEDVFLYDGICLSIPSPFGGVQRIGKCHDAGPDPWDGQIGGPAGG